MPQVNPRINDGHTHAFAVEARKQRRRLDIVLSTRKADDVADRRLPRLGARVLHLRSFQHLRVRGPNVISVGLHVLGEESGKRMAAAAGGAGGGW